MCGPRREREGVSQMMGGTIAVELFEETVCSKYQDDKLGFQREFMVS